MLGWQGQSPCWFGSAHLRQAEQQNGSGLGFPQHVGHRTLGVAVCQFVVRHQSYRLLQDQMTPHGSQFLTPTSSCSKCLPHLRHWKDSEWRKEALERVSTRDSSMESQLALPQPERQPSTPPRTRASELDKRSALQTPRHPQNPHCTICPYRLQGLPLGLLSRPLKPSSSFPLLPI